MPKPHRPPWVVMLLENYPYPQDIRVRAEASALVRAGMRVTVVAPRASGQPARETVDGVAVRRFRLPRDRQGKLPLFIEYTIAHLALLRNALILLVRGADVVHVHNPPDTMFVALWLARRFGRKTVFDNHDLMPDLFAVRFGDTPFLKVVVWAQRRACQFADLVIASNGSQAQVAAAVGAKNVLVVRNGPPRWMLQPQDEVADRASRSKPPFNITYLGVLGPQDDVGALPTLLARIRSTYNLDARLTVIGDGSERSLLEREADRLDVHRFLHVTGRVPHEKVPAYLAAADVCIDHSPCNRFNDRCTMMKVSEYLAAGKPVVTYPLRETVQSASDAVRYAKPNDLDDFAEQVSALLRDPSERIVLARRARERAESLVWERSEERLLEGYALLTAELE